MTPGRPERTLAVQFLSPENVFLFSGLYCPLSWIAGMCAGLIDLPVFADFCGGRCYDTGLSILHRATIVRLCVVEL